MAPRSALRTVLAATVPPLVVFGVQSLIWSTISPFAWFLFYPAVFLAAWLGGFYGGIGATLLSAMLVWWSFVPPEGTLFKEEPRFLLTGAIYIVMGVVVSVFQERLKRANREAATALAATQRANESLQKAITERQIFAALIENSSDFIGIAGADGKPIYLNPAGREMVGMAPDYPIEGTQIPEYYPPNQRAFATQVIVKEMAEHGHWQGETYFRNWKTEAAIPVSDTHFMIREPGTGRVLGMGTVTRDISDIKRAQEASEAANRSLQKANDEITLLYEKTKQLDELKTQFFANVSHELRTPLALILGPTERILRTPGLSEAARTDLDVISRNARMLVARVNDMLDMAKLDAGRMVPDYAEVDLSRLVRFVAGHFEVLSVERGTELRVDVPDGLIAQLDPDMVQRMVMNLLSNAFKFTPSGGRVRVSLRHAGDRFVVEVGDSGPGVPADKRDEVFERFRQLEEGPTRSYAGTGLGLSIVRDFASVLRGSVSVADAPEGGALFVLELPSVAPEGCTVRPRFEPEQTRGVEQLVEELREPTATATVASATSEEDQRPLVLVVEDNRDMNAFIAQALTSDGFRVASAFDGREGYKQATELRPDLVLTDIMMPRMSGDELVRALRERPELASTPIVVLSAKADDELRVRLLREGAQDYLTKPFAEEELRARACSHVARKRAEERSNRLREQVESVANASMAISEAVAHLPETSLQAVLDMIALKAQQLTSAELAAVGVGREPGGRLKTWAYAGGFPNHEPVVKSFLGVPIHHRDRAIGTLYLANKRGQLEFTEQDHRMVDMLAKRAGVAIETARLYAAEGMGRAWLQAVVDQMPEGIILMDASGHVTVENHSVGALAGPEPRKRDCFGNSIALDLRRPSGEPLSPDDLPNVRAIVHEETTHSSELVARRADGKLVPVLVSAAPVRSADGGIAGATMVVQDVSALKELERLREEWASIVAHDLQQPINTIVLRADLLLRTRLADPQREGVSQIRNAAKRMGHMVSDLMDASQIEARRMRISLDRVDLAAHVRDVVAHLPQVAARTRVRAPTDLRLFVRADAERIEQVLSNLLSNAVKYGSPDGEISIEVALEGDSARISVANQGPGIPADELETLFERYVRARAVRASGTKGAGLGLYIARGLVEAHGGRIWATSVPGVMTAFHFTIPLDGPPIAIEAPPQPRLAEHP